MTPITKVPAGLLDAVKARFDVTWQDDVTDQKYTEMILSAMAYLDEKRGEPADYTVPGEPRTLLMEYVRYDRDSALDVFESNYLSRILAMQNQRKVDSYVESTVSAP